MLANLTMSHYNDESIIVYSGSWCLEECTIASSRKGKRACAAIVAATGANVRLLRCCISDASTAVRLDSMPCSLYADACTFHNLKECIATRGGGDVMVYTSTFEQTDTALKLDDTVRGQAVECHFGEGATLFGQYRKPKRFVMRNNTYATPELQEEADDEEAAEAAEAAAAIAAAEAAEEAAAVAAAQAAAEAAAAAAAAEEEEEAPYDDEEDDDGSGEDGDEDGGMVLGEDDRPGGWSEHEEDEGVYEAEKLVGYRVSRVRARFACMRAHARAAAAFFCMHACILPNSFFLLSCVTGHGGRRLPPRHCLIPRPLAGLPTGVRYLGAL